MATTTPTPTDPGAVPTATDESPLESVLPTPTPTPACVSAPSAASMLRASSPVISPTSPVSPVLSPGPVRPSLAPESAVRPSPATPARLATAVRSQLLPMVLDSPTPPQQMAMQLLRAGFLEEPRRSRALAALLALPDARHLEFRALDSNDLPNLVRMQNLEAAVGYTVGDLAQPQCTDCAAGHGQFLECVRVGGYLHGSCTNCHFGGEGARCSLRGFLAPSAPPSAPSTAPVTGSPSGRHGLRARRPAAAAASCAVEALTEEAHRGRKRAAPQLKDGCPSRRARACSPSPPRNDHTTLPARLRAAASRGGFQPTEELGAAIRRFRDASPPSREMIRLRHSLLEVAMNFVAFEEGVPAGFITIEGSRQLEGQMGREERREEEREEESRGEKA